jgi:hypothetical protein
MLKWLVIISWALSKGGYPSVSSCAATRVFGAHYRREIATSSIAYQLETPDKPSSEENLYQHVSSTLTATMLWSVHLLEEACEVTTAPNPWHAVSYRRIPALRWEVWEAVVQCPRSTQSRVTD